MYEWMCTCNFIILPFNTEIPKQTSEQENVCKHSCTKQKHR